MKEAKIEVRYLDHMGDDLAVVNAARVSFNKERKELSKDDKPLIYYLARHSHWTPFAHTALKIHVKAPLFVARQLVKHQVGLVWNEVSRRYVDDEPEFWFPTTFHKRPDASIKQGSGDKLSRWHTKEALQNIHIQTKFALEEYLDLLGYVSPEEARMVLPLNTMTEWIWTGNVAAWARVYNLRIDTYTQTATREFAAELGKIVKEYFPISWEALTE